MANLCKESSCPINVTVFVEELHRIYPHHIAQLSMWGVSGIIQKLQFWRASFLLQAIISILTEMVDNV
jgi:hypothetical protein